MSIRITKRMVDAAMPEDAIRFVWDADVKGFALRVTPNGVKSYVLQYRTGSGRSRRYTIGKHGSPWTPETARREAERLLRLVAAGEDPQASKEEARKPKDDDRFTAVATQFIERYAKPSNKSWAETKRILDRDVGPSWGERPITEIRRGDVIRLLDGVVDSGRPVHANRVFSAIRKLFNWCVERGILETSPCLNLKAPTRERPRDRVLTADELGRIWRAADALPYPYGPWIKLLILTAQRRDEVAHMTWSEVDLDAGLWTIPRERAKNDQAHHVHLSSVAVELLRTLPRWEVSEFVFSATGRTPISAFSDAKETLDARVVANLQQEAKGRGDTPDAVKPLPDWRFHDLRRTAATMMAEMGIPPHVVDKILNHTQGTIKGVAAIYNRHQYLEERKQALEAWAERLGALSHRSRASDEEPVLPV